MSTSAIPSGRREATVTHDRLGRPKKPPFAVRTKRANLRLNALEHTVLSSRAKLAGKDLMPYIREAALNTGDPVRTSRTTDPELLTKLEQQAAQIRMLGNVVNQVARDIHTGRQVDQEWDLIPDQIQQTLVAIQQTVDTLVLGDDS